MIRDPYCTSCPMHQGAHGENRCVIGKGQPGARIMVVTKTPVSGGQIRSLLARHELRVPVYVTAAVKCSTGQAAATPADVKVCRAYLDREIAQLQPEWILALGNEALLSVTGHSGIMKHRGKIYPRKDNPAIQVMGTMNPSALHINPSYETGFASDLRLFVSLVSGVKRETKSILARVATEKNINSLFRDLQSAHGVAFDLETTSFEEYQKDSAVISMSVALWQKESTDVEKIWAIPLHHPESEFQQSWKSRFNILTNLIQRIPVKIAQNAKFDCRWTAEFGEQVIATFDTMVAAHLIDENRSKSLESLGREHLVIPSWKMDTSDLLSVSLKEVLRYNSRDALHTARLYFILRDQLKAKPKLARLFKLLAMPVSNALVEAERDGIWIDRLRLNERWEQVKQRLIEIDNALMQWVPASSPHEVNFNPSNFLRWWVFEHLGLPVIKETDTGNPCLDLATKHHLAEHHPVMPLLIERAKQGKMDSCFFSAYDELMDHNDRVHTTFNLAKTVTGRLSSGGLDRDKTLSKPIRAVNFQNVPTDPFVRSVIGSPPKRIFIDADYSQLEFRLACMLANDEMGLHAFATGQDIHLIMAAQLTDKILEEVTKPERTRAKPINFGFLYGSWEKTFIETAWDEYQIEFTMQEARKARRTFFDTWRQLEPWHERQRALVRKNGLVTTLFGRVRRLPNIRSSKETMRWHAERQAINAPVQSLGSDITQLAYLEIRDKLKQADLDVRGLGTVHDSLLYEGDETHIAQTLPIIKETMENLPIKRKFGVDITVPLVTNITCSLHWGEGQELTDAEIYDWKGL